MKPLERIKGLTKELKSDSELMLFFQSIYPKTFELVDDSLMANEQYLIQACKIISQKRSTKEPDNYTTKEFKQLKPINFIKRIYNEEVRNYLINKNFDKFLFLSQEIEKFYLCKKLNNDLTNNGVNATKLKI